MTSPALDPLFQFVGNTPLVPLNRLFPNDKGIEVYAKLEYYNPSGSVKDRIVAHILRNAIESGALRPGGKVVEGTSGNTGASLAFFCARLGYELTLVTMAKVSEEKKNHMRMLGANLVVCPTEAERGTNGHYVTRSHLLAQETGAFLVNQYDNPLNIEAHYLTTGPEIWRQTGGLVDWFVTGGSTGGTITGTGRYLKEKNPKLRVMLSDPVGSVYAGVVKNGVINPADHGTYKVEGVGEDIINGAMDISVIDDAMQFTDAEAFDMCKRCARAEGILPGLSAGGNLAVIEKMIARMDGPARIVTLIQDSGVKYLSKLLAAT